MSILPSELDKINITNDVTKGTGIAIDEGKLESIKVAAQIFNEVRDWIVGNVVPGMKMIDVTREIEAQIEQRCSEYRSGRIKCSIGFPVGININNYISSYSVPEASVAVIGENDLCKIEFGVHHDGWLVSGAFCLTALNKTMAERKSLDIMCNMCCETTRLICDIFVPGRKLGDIGNKIHEILTQCESTFPNIRFVRTIFGHDVQQNNIQGKYIVPVVKRGLIHEGLLKQFDLEHIVVPGEQYEFELSCALDMDALPKNIDVTECYMMPFGLERRVNIALRSSKKIYAMCQKHFGNFPFTLRQIIPLCGDMKRNAIMIGVTYLTRLGILVPIYANYLPNVKNICARYKYSLLVADKEPLVLMKY
jgi:methionyl aminopeptidase